MSQASCVHEADHQHFAAHVILHDRRNQSVEFREIHIVFRTTKNPAISSGGAACGRVFRVLVLVPPRAQSCRPAMMAVVMVMRAVEEHDHELTKATR